MLPETAQAKDEILPVPPSPTFSTAVPSLMTATAATPAATMPKSAHSARAAGQGEHGIRNTDLLLEVTGSALPRRSRENRPIRGYFLHKFMYSPRFAGTGIPSLLPRMGLGVAAECMVGEAGMRGFCRAPARDPVGGDCVSSQGSNACTKRMAVGLDHPVALNVGRKRESFFPPAFRAPRMVQRVSPACLAVRAAVNRTSRIGNWSFGENSSEYEAVGGTRSSERKKGTGRKPKSEVGK